MPRFCKNERCLRNLQIEGCNYSQNQVIGKIECSFCFSKHLLCLKCNYTTLSNSSKYKYNEGLRRISLHLKRCQQIPRVTRDARNADTDISNRYDHSAGSEDDVQDDDNDVSISAVDHSAGSENDVQGVQSNQSADKGNDIDSYKDAIQDDGNEVSTIAGNKDDIQGVQSNQSAYEEDDIDISNPFDHSAGSNEDDIQGDGNVVSASAGSNEDDIQDDGNNVSMSDCDDESSVPPLIQKKKKSIWRAFISDDDSDDSDDEWLDLDCISKCSQSSDDTWDDRYCDTDKSLVDAADSAARKEIDINDEIQAVPLLELARELEESYKVYELDDLDFSPNRDETSCLADEFYESDNLDGVDMPVKEPSELKDQLPYSAFSNIFQYNIKGKAPHQVNQNVLYFQQQSLVMSLTNKNNRIGGFCGLVGRANIRDCEHRTVRAKEEEAMVVLRYIRLVNMLPIPLCETFMSYEKGKLGLFGPGINSRNVETSFPSSLLELEAFAGTAKHAGKHSIMKNFPVPKVFILNKHACIDLKEAILHIAGHRGGFGFA